jgi:hypothetical protein
MSALCMRMHTNGGERGREGWGDNEMLSIKNNNNKNNNNTTA